MQLIEFLSPYSKAIAEQKPLRRVFGRSMGQAPARCWAIFLLPELLIRELGGLLVSRQHWKIIAAVVELRWDVIDNVLNYVKCLSTCSYLSICINPSARPGVSSQLSPSHLRAHEGRSVVFT